MTKPLSNKIHIRNIGDFFAEKDIKLYTKRHAEIDAKVLLRFYAPTRDFMCYILTPTAEISAGIPYVIEKVVRQKKMLTLMHRTRNRNVDEAADHVLSMFGLDCTSR